MEENNKIRKSFSGSVPQAIIVAGLIIAGSIFINNHAVKSETKSVDKLDLVATVSKDDFVRGNKSAPVTIIEYADFSCHFCAQFHPTLIKLLAEYDGQIKWVYRDLPIFNIEAAISGQCVGKISGEEAFWSFADKLFANQGSFSSDFYRQTAVSFGVDEDKYDECIFDPLLKSRIQKDFTENKLLFGFNATPYNIIVDKDGRKFSFPGALPYENLKSVIDRLISK